jgi:hypothetical protein
MGDEFALLVLSTNGTARKFSPIVCAHLGKNEFCWNHLSKGFTDASHDQRSNIPQ